MAAGPTGGARAAAAVAACRRSKRRWAVEAVLGKLRAATGARRSNLARGGATGRQTARPGKASSSDIRGLGARFIGGGRELRRCWWEGKEAAAPLMTMMVERPFLVGRGNEGPAALVREELKGRWGVGAAQAAEGHRKVEGR